MFCFLIFSDVFRVEHEDEKMEDEDDEDFDPEDEEEDPYSNLTLEELKARLPAYMFLDEAEKKQYFKDLNQRYFEEYETLNTYNPSHVSTKKDVLFSGQFTIRSKLKEAN